MLFHYQRTDAAVSACTDYRLNVNDVRELKNFQRFLENIGFSLTISWNTECFSFICLIFLPLKRKRIVSLHFGRDVRTRLGIAISEVSGPLVFHIKAGCPVMCLAQEHNKRTCRLVLHHLPSMPSAKQGSCRYHFLRSFGMTRQGD